MFQCSTTTPAELDKLDWKSEQMLKAMFEDLSRRKKALHAARFDRIPEPTNPLQIGLPNPLTRGACLQGIPAICIRFLEEATRKDAKQADTTAGVLKASF